MTKLQAIQHLPFSIATIHFLHPASERCILILRTMTRNTRPSKQLTIIKITEYIKMDFKDLYR